MCISRARFVEWLECLVALVGCMRRAANAYPHAHMLHTLWHCRLPRAVDWVQHEAACVWLL
jgi:hypothetical protein